MKPVSTIVVGVIGLCTVLLVGCFTTRPTSDALGSLNYPTWEQHSGILAFNEHVLIITPGARVYYNALITQYGTRISASVTNADDGLVMYSGTNNAWRAEQCWVMTREACNKWAAMALLSKKD